METILIVIGVYIVGVIASYFTQAALYLYDLIDPGDDLGNFRVIFFSWIYIFFCVFILLIVLLFSIISELTKIVVGIFKGILTPENLIKKLKKKDEYN